MIVSSPIAPGIRRLLHAIAVGVFGLALAPAASAGPGLDRLDRFFAGLKSLDTGFVQIVSDSSQDRKSTRLNSSH